MCAIPEAKIYIFHKQVEIVKKDEKMLNGMEDVSIGWLDQQALPFPWPAPTTIGKVYIFDFPTSYSTGVAT